MGTNLDDMLGRIDQEIAASKNKIDELRKSKVQEVQGREDRLKLFEKDCEALKGVWAPRLEALKKKFGEKVKVTPQVAGGRRSALFEFNSDLARITLTFSVSTDVDVKNLVIEYRLEILPILMKFNDKDALEQPIGKVNAEQVGKWIEDRIVDFVKTFLSLHENEFYLKAHMVEDPVAKVKFPKFAAAASLERDGKTVYFISNETREQFEKSGGGKASEGKKAEATKKSSKK